MPDEKIRDIWRKYGVLPPSLADGTRLGYTSCMGELLCAKCANDQCYDKHSPQLASVVLVCETGYLCDRCLKELGVEA